MEEFNIPIHNSLTKPILMGGVPREIAILNGTFTSAMVLGLHSLLALPLGIVFHIVGRAFAKKDNLFFHTFRRHIWQKNYYQS